MTSECKSFAGRYDVASTSCLTRWCQKNNQSGKSSPCVKTSVNIGGDAADRIFRFGETPYPKRLSGNDTTVQTSKRTTVEGTVSTNALRRGCRFVISYTVQASWRKASNWRSCRAEPLLSYILTQKTKISTIQKLAVQAPSHKKTPSIIILNLLSRRDFGFIFWQKCCFSYSWR